MSKRPEITKISIHAPLTGSDSTRASLRTPHHISQPTLPSQGATKRMVRKLYSYTISIHAPLTGSDPSCAIWLPWFCISIHAPLTGSDSADQAQKLHHTISIHAPLTGSDQTDITNQFNSYKFQSTLPSQGATKCCFCGILTIKFQSTLPSQGATEVLEERVDELIISIHAPLTGSDYS